ncbi:MAG: hypothetical protein AMXMBFR13_09560 [Phycisphaerae bacterium]|jgi:hypothetical protein
MSDTAPNPEMSAQPVILRSWPKIILMFPTLVVAIVCGILMSIYGAPDPTRKDFDFRHMINLVFLIVLALNLILLLYDLTLRGFLIVALSVIVVVLALFLINQQTGKVWDTLRRVLSIRVYANAAFHFLFAAVLIVNMFIAWVITRFHYWVVERNEIIIHNGFMHEQQRHPTSSARFRLEIDDVVEYALFGSGKLVFTFADDRSEHILPTIMRVRGKAKQLDLLLGRVAVTQN